MLLFHLPNANRLLRVKLPRNNNNPFSLAHESVGVSPFGVQVSCRGPSPLSVNGNAKSYEEGVEKACEKDWGQRCHQSVMVPKVSAEGEKAARDG